MSDAELIADPADPAPRRPRSCPAPLRPPRTPRGTNEFISFLQNFLLAFAGIALFVGSFVIANSLSITIAQRTREFATMRTLGASRRQVLVSILIESLVVGTLPRPSGLFARPRPGEAPVLALRRRWLHAAEQRPPLRDEDDRRRAARRHPRHARGESPPRIPCDSCAADRCRARRRDTAGVAFRALPHARIAAADGDRVRRAPLRALRRSLGTSRCSSSMGIGALLDLPRRRALLRARRAAVRSGREPAWHMGSRRVCRARLAALHAAVLAPALGAWGPGWPWPTGGALRSSEPSSILLWRSSSS